MNQQTLVGLALVSAGCVFGGGGIEENNESDLNNENNTADMSAPDAADSGDNNVMPDMADPLDLAMPDLAMPDLAVPDLAMPDMAPDVPPFLVEAEIPINLSGATPTLAFPTEVTGFATGFLIGFADDLNDRALFAWYSSDSAEPIASDAYMAELLDVDVAMSPQGGFGVFMSNDSMSVAHFEPNLATTSSWSSAVHTVDLTSTDKRELAYARENGTNFVMVNSISRSTALARVSVRTTDENGWGFANEANIENLDMQNIEVIGGQRATGFRLLGAGVVGTTYRLNEHDRDPANAGFWTITQRGCGAASTGARIVPVGDDWALTKAGTQLNLVQCVLQGDSVTIAHTVVTPQDTVTDFDVGRENLVFGGGFGMAWVDGDVPMFGIVTRDETNGAPTVGRAMALPGRAARARLAFNPTRNQWGVVLTSAAGSRLVILESNPDF